MSEITYIPKFLTSDEADALFAACAGLDYGERPMNNETHEHAIPKVKNCGKIRDTLRRFQRRQVLHE